MATAHVSSDLQTVRIVEDGSERMTITVSLPPLVPGQVRPYREILTEALAAHAWHPVNYSDQRLRSDGFEVDVEPLP